MKGLRLLEINVNLLISGSEDPGVVLGDPSRRLQSCLRQCVRLHSSAADAAQGFIKIWKRQIFNYGEKNELVFNYFPSP